MENDQKKKITQNELILFIGLAFSFFSVLGTWFTNEESFIYRGTHFFTGILTVLSSLTTLIVMTLPYFELKLSDFIEKLEHSEEKVTLYGSVLTVVFLSANILFTVFKVFFQLGDGALSNGFFFGLISVVVTYFALLRYNKDKQVGFKFSFKRNKNSDQI